MDDAPKAASDRIKAETEALLKKAKDAVDRADINIKENDATQPPTAQTPDQKIQNLQELKAVQKGLEKSKAQLTQQREVITAELNKTEQELAETNLSLHEKQKALSNAPDDFAKELLREEIVQLSEKRDQLSEKKEQLTELRDKTDEALQQIKERAKSVDQLVKNTEAEINENPQIVNKRRGRAGKILAAPIRLGFRTARDTIRKINPLEKKVNKRDTADHGVEALRLANNTVKTVHSTVKTTTRTAKTIVKAPINTVRVMRGTAVATYRLTSAVIRVTGTVLIHTLAVFMNPIILMLALLVIIGVLTASFIAQIANTDGTEQAQTIAMAYSDAAGVGDIEEKYPDAANYYRIACENNRNAFEAKISSLFYRYDDLKNSDLVYMQRNLNGALTTYSKGFPSDTYKGTLKSAWKILIPEKEAVAIAYVYLEMQENNSKGTAQAIYDVTFTQDVFNTIVNAAVLWNDTTFAHQECPSRNCSLHTEKRLNPEYTEASNAYDQAVNAKSDWNANVKPKSDAYITALNAYNTLLMTYNATPPAGRPFIEPALNAAKAARDNALSAFRQVVGNWCLVFHYTGLVVNNTLDSDMQTILTKAVNDAKTKLDHTDQYITTTYRTCDHLHTLHSIGLYGYSKDTVMNTLGFTNNYKEWEALTEFGLNSNPNL